MQAAIPGLYYTLTHGGSTGARACAYEDANPGRYYVTYYSVILYITLLLIFLFLVIIIFFIRQECVWPQGWS